MNIVLMGIQCTILIYYNYRAKTETIKTFYVYEKDVNTDEFVQAFAEDPNVENADALNINSSDYEIQKILEKCENKKGNKSSMISHLNYFPGIVVVLMILLYH